ncbi:hypothetical protein B9G69_012500 [Bdellovibrio sp. SKB1291214]|uniref:hypothetical protein n=1 Tax=Bdellovibrio sp. SKB1291214 TaxID=1732569 RepID=UPI000B51DBDC|nr:hypothetical protein [Bdellovibrio sp. SKB1291214]UYL07866.1 hypothetical protein B9G69_012500 [Bdellovibrio sp. SKB1291214]
MNIFDFISTQHMQTTQKAELINRLVSSDQSSRKIFTKDLYRHLEDLFQVEQLSFYLPLLNTMSYSEITETSLSHQRDILNSIKLLQHQEGQDASDTLLRICAHLNLYQSNQQAFLIPVMRKQLNESHALQLGQFAHNIFEQLQIGVGIREAYDNASHLVPAHLAPNTKGKLKTLCENAPF